MRLLDRYIIKTVLSAIALVTLMLAGLQIFILFVNQLDELGRAYYSVFQAIIFVLLQMPYQVYLFFPMASLLGSLIGLGILANHRELVVMRAAGMSIWQITLAVLKSALVAILIVTIVGETLVPRLAHIANDKKLQAMSSGQALRTKKGVWLRYQNDFITIGTVVSDHELHNIYQFHFDEQHHLRLARAIKQLNFVNGHWFGLHVSESLIEDNHITPKLQNKIMWEVQLQPNILKVSSREPDEMTLSELYQYLRVQKLNHQTALNYQLAFWQRLIQPLTTIVMMLLAIPFIFGPLRSSTMGSKLLAGVTMGFSFHIMNHFFGPISQVFQWPPEIAAFGPTLVFALVGIFLMRRVR